MLKKIIINLRDIAISSSIFASALYAYIYHHSHNNQTNYLQSIHSETLRDASRLTNDSFGISWGFQSDDTIMSRIDSGDLLFIKYECFECITPDSMIHCYLKTSHYLQQQYHSVGYAFRNQSGLYVMFNQFGQTKVKPYTQIVSLPYIRELTLQKRDKNKLKAHILLSKQISSQIQIKESSLQFAQRVQSMLKQAAILQSINDLLGGEQRINIRTETNKTLRSL